MEILEHQLVGKLGKPDLCEDAWTATPHFACVIDGATTKGDLLFNGQTSGRMAALLVKDAIKKLDPQASCLEAVDFLTQTIAEFCKERGMYAGMQDKHWNRMACSVAIFSAARREVWLIGDCQCVVDGQHHTVEKAIDRVLSSMRANYLEALLKTGATIEELRRHDRGREFILPMLKQQSQYQNSHAKHPYAYGLLDGFPVNANSIKAISVKGERVSLATDGYPRMFGSLEETEQYLAKILREDPLCFRLYQATKGMMEGALSFDDRTYLTVKG